MVGEATSRVRDVQVSAEEARLQPFRALLAAAGLSFGLSTFVAGVFAVFGGPRGYGALWTVVIIGLTWWLAYPPRRWVHSVPQWVLAVVVGLVLAFAGAVLADSSLARRDVEVRVSVEDGDVERVCVREECFVMSDPTVGMVFRDVSTNRLVKVEVTTTTGSLSRQIDAHDGCIDLRLVNDVNRPVRQSTCR